MVLETYLTVEGLGNASDEDLAAIAELTDEDRAGIARAVADAKAPAPANEESAGGADAGQPE